MNERSLSTARPRWMGLLGILLLLVAFVWGPARPALADTSTTTTCSATTTTGASTTSSTDPGSSTTADTTTTTTTDPTSSTTAGSTSGASDTTATTAGSKVADVSHPLSSAPIIKSGLAFTGADIAGSVVGAGLLIGAGLVLVSSARRRARNRTGTGTGQTMGCAVVGLVLARIVTPDTVHPLVSSCVPPVLPESPISLLLPVAGAAVFAGAVLLARRRGSSQI